MTDEERRVLKTSIVDAIQSLDSWRQEDVERGGIRVHLQCTKKELEFLLDLIEDTEELEKMTNGEVFDSIIDVDNDCVEVYGKNGLMYFAFSQEWWNAPHKRAVKDDKRRSNQD